MKQPTMALGLTIAVLVLLVSGVASIRARSAEPTLTPYWCHAHDGIPRVVFSSDGKYLAAAWPPNTVRVWNAKTGAVVSVLGSALIDNQERMAFSPDNRYVITGGNAGILVLWDVVTGEKIRVFELAENSPARQKQSLRILSFALSPDGRYIAILDTSKGSLASINSGKQLFTFPTTHPGDPYIQFSPDGKHIMIGDRVWDAKTGQLVYEFSMINNSLYSPDGKYILGIDFSSYDLILIDAKSYRTVRTLNAFDTKPTDWQFSPDGKYLLATKTEGVVRLWEVATGKLLHEFQAATQYGVRPTFLNNQAILTPKRIEETPTSQTILVIRDIATGAQVQEVTIEVSLLLWATFMAMAPDGKSFAISSFVGDYDTIVTSWDIRTGKRILQFC
jgi:WD40 repeat protein